MTPVLARAHYEQMARYFADLGHVALRPGELCYLAVASEEPAGKPILACRKVQVSLELAASEDQDVLRDRGLAFWDAYGSWYRTPSPPFGCGNTGPKGDLARGSHHCFSSGGAILIDGHYVGC